MAARDGGHLDDALVGRYLAAQLAPDAVAEVERHLATCDTCADRLAGAGATRAEGGSSGTAGSAGSPGLAGDGTAAAPAPRQRGDALGRYVVVDRLGEGGMGVVYAAYDPELDRRVAIKVVRAAPGSSRVRRDAQARLLREAQAMARVAHPNVVAVHDVGPLDGGVFVAMEFVEGRTLRAALKDGTRRSWREVLDLFLQAGRGLAAAHQAGLVHRDFKPENVLLRRDGRAAVTDFGLARLATDGGTEPPDSWDDRSVTGATSASVRLSDELTRAGTVMGTPSYMAPEQFAGLAADARSDQFAFCAALYWALFGVRPFDPEALSAYARRTLVGGDRATPADAALIRPAPAEPKVPGWLKRAVLRGLTLDAQGRYPSMDALLGDVERRLARPRQRWLVAAAVLLVGGVAGGVAAQRSAQARLCSGSRERLAGVWDDRARVAVETAFLGTKAEDAPRQFARTAEALEAYARSWAAMHQEACEATRLRREQSEELLERRMACLDQRAKELGKLTALFTVADAKLVGRAPEAALQLSSVRACADAAVLSGLVPMPEDPAARAVAQKASDLVAEANALRLAGQLGAALEEAQAAAVLAPKGKYRPVEATAAYYQGILEERTGRITEAEQTLVRAIALSDAARDDVLKARASAQLVYLLSQRSRFTEAHHWNTLGFSALERLGGTNAEAEPALLDAEGTLLLSEARYADALDRFGRAAKLHEAELGREHPRYLSSRGNAAAAYLKLGRAQEAITVLEELTGTIARLRGPEHPTLATPLSNLAHAHLLARHFDRAHQVVEQALTLAKKRFGERHLAWADAKDLEAYVFEEEHRYAEALEAYRASLKVKEQALGPDDPELSYSYDGIGQSLLALGRAREAIPALERARALRGKDPEGRAKTTFALARAMWSTGQRGATTLALGREAEALFREADKKERVEEVTRWLSAPR